MSGPPVAPKYSLKWGWVCLAVGVLALLVAGPLGAIVAGPLILVALILSIIGMAKNNTGGGVALLLSALFLPAIAFVIWMVLLALLKMDNVPDAGPDDLPAIMEETVESSGPVDAGGGPGNSAEADEDGEDGEGAASGTAESADPFGAN